MKRLAKNLPDHDWTPPVEAWEFALPADMRAAIVYLGCQGDAAAGARFRQSVAEASAAAGPGVHVEYAKVDDPHGAFNTVAILYWRQAAAFEAWRAGPGAERLLRPSAYGAGGLWMETYTVDRKNIETLFSSADQSPGIATFGKRIDEPTLLHGYYGSMRDRIIASNDSDHRSDIDAVLAHGKPGLEPVTHRIEAPRHLCAIRSGQDWSACSGAQRDFYLNELRPVLQKGMAYLQDNPTDSGCLSCLMMTETDVEGRELERTFGYAVFRDIADLEAWAKSHPTHIAIFDKFIEFATAFDNKIDLRLWHEVLVTKEPQTFTYQGCHPHTGILPYFG